MKLFKDNKEVSRFLCNVYSEIFINKSIFTATKINSPHKTNQFYRYTPLGRKEDRKMAFSVPGAMVNVARSNDRQVLLQNVQKASAGVYRCQVSVEGTFRSVSVEKTMSVVDNNDNNNSTMLNKTPNQQNRHNFHQSNRGSTSKGGNNNLIPSMLEPITQGQQQASSSSSSDGLKTQSFNLMISWCGAIQLVILYNILNWTF